MVIKLELEIILPEVKQKLN